MILYFEKCRQDLIIVLQSEAKVVRLIAKERLSGPLPPLSTMSYSLGDLDEPGTISQH